MSLLEWSTPSGSIGTATEGSNFSFFFAFNMVPYGNLILTSGELPSGLTFNALDASISGIVGTVDTTTVYPFTLRLQNELGVNDRSFSITAVNQTPSWITPEEIVQDNGQNYRTKMLIDKQLEILNPSNVDLKFELIAGNLPEELSLLEDGRLVGFTSSAGSYFFTAKVAGITKTFHLTLLNDSQNRPPFWSTITGYIGNADSGTDFSFNFKGADGDLNAVSFELHPDDSLPNGLTFTGSSIVGNIAPSEVGNKFFRIIISDGVEDITRLFYVKANLGDLNEISFDIAISPLLSFNSSNILIQDEPSYLKVTAFQQFGDWLRYQVFSGLLPSGMTLNISTGEIEGSSIVVGTYNFVIRAYNNLGIESFQNFTIVINTRQEYNSNKMCAIVTGYDRLKLNDLYNSSIIPYDMIYRAGDKNFGTTLSNEVLIHKYVNGTKTQIYNVLENRIGSEAIPIKFKNVPVQNSFGQKICECVILVFEDSARYGVESVTYNSSVVEIASLDLIREKLSEMSLAPFVSFANWQSEIYTPVIENDIFNIPNHDFYTGKIVYFKNQNVPSPFLNNTIYYAIVVDKDNIRIANSKTEASNGNYIRFNINEVSRNGILHTQHTAIPFVYCNSGFGDRVSNALNSLSLADIKLYFKHFVYGPTTPESQEDLELVWFEEQRI